MIAKSSVRLFAMLLAAAASAMPSHLQGAAPTIVTQPQSLSVATDATASFQVVAAGDAPLRYRWRFKGNALAGATNSTLTVAGVTLFNGGAYDVVITNTAGAITSQVATLTVDASLVFRVLALRTNGFIAQEVEQAAHSIGYDFSGVDAPKNENDFYGLRYAEFVVPLVKAVQELSTQNAALQQTLLALQQEVELLKTKVNASPINID